MSYSFRKSIEKGLEQYEKMKDDMFYFSYQLKKVKEALKTHGIEADIEINDNLATLFIYQSKLVVINKTERYFYSDFDKQVVYEDREEVVSYMGNILQSVRFWMFIKSNKDVDNV